jgi:murein DD-endopeptidase MepM/ murein hydrolase activator NlpD
VNLKSDRALPYTAAFPPLQTTEAFSVLPVDPAAKWEYTYTNYFKLGSNCVRHDDSCVYQLPYLAGSKYTVTQGYNGGYSHKGSNLYAIDWKMPEGTLVCAARGGVVVKTKDDSDTGGGSVKFDKFNNYVLVRHEDGTLGHYCHLKKGGVMVKPGERISAGQPIAKSGNTGYSSGPHLHFCVYRTKDGRERESIPVKFRTANEIAVTLQEDRRYKAAEITTLTTAAVRNQSANREQGAASVPSIQE